MNIVKPNPLNLVVTTEGGQGRDVVDAVIASGERPSTLYSLGGVDHFEMGALRSINELQYKAEEDYFFGSRWTEAIGSIISTRLDSTELVNVIHPRAYVSNYASLAQNVFVGANAVVNPQVQLGSFVFINAGSVLDHDCKIGGRTSLGPGVSFPGFVTVGENCAIGAGVVARPGITIVAGCTIGAGAVVVKDLTEPGTYVGNPARKL